MNAGGVDIWSWYTDIPPVSRYYLTTAFLTTALCALDVLSPFKLYYNWGLIRDGQVWRLFTTFLFFGHFSLDFLFHMYFLVRYCRLLEDGEFRGRTADFVFLLLFGATAMTAVAPFVSMHFLGSSLTFMMVYIWGRRNEHVRMSFLGLFPFTAPYLPWVLLCLSLALNNRHTLSTDMIGIVVGHTYFFLVYIYPEVAAIRGWRIRKIVHTPHLLKVLFGGADWTREDNAIRVVHGAAGMNPFENLEDRDVPADGRELPEGQGEGDGPQEGGDPGPAEPAPQQGLRPHND
ncbi:unnamed protein product [Chrysoparadoxa australica]